MQLGGKPSDLVQQLEDGVVDMIWTVAGFTPGRFPGLEGVELPFVNTGNSATNSPFVMEFAEKWLNDSEFKGIRVMSIHTTDAAAPTETSGSPRAAEKNARPPDRHPAA